MLALWHGYCPVCFRNGKSHTIVAQDDPRVNLPQAQCTRVAYLMQCLDLSRPGERCINKTACSLRCLICGVGMLVHEDSEFETIVSALDAKKPSQKEATQGICRDLGMAFTPLWNQPVHRKCVIKGGCGCFMPRCFLPGYPACKIHPEQKKDAKQTGDTYQRSEHFDHEMSLADTSPKQPSKDWTSLLGKMQPAEAKKPIKRKQEVKTAKEPLFPKKAKVEWNPYAQDQFGYWFVKGVLCYKHPDGRVIHGVTGVDDI